MNEERERELMRMIEDLQKQVASLPQRLLGAQDDVNRWALAKITDATSGGSGDARVYGVNYITGTFTEAVGQQTLTQSDLHAADVFAAADSGGKTLAVDDIVLVIEMHGRRWLVPWEITAASSATTARGIPGGRITPSSSDTDPGATTATTIYYLPYIHREIELHDGASTWSVFDIGASGLSLSLSGDASNCYDLFCYDNSGSAALERLVWTNTTTRATALAEQDGILVKSGDATRRYLGTYYLESTGNCVTAIFKAPIYNFYNRLPKLVEFNATGKNVSMGTSVGEFGGVSGFGTTKLLFVNGILGMNYAVEGHIYCESDGTGTGVVCINDSVALNGFQTNCTVNHTFECPISINYRRLSAPIGLNTVYGVEQAAVNTVTIGGAGINQAWSARTVLQM